MTSVLRRHGATLVERHGRTVAAHFGSPASEAAVCRGAVGMAERSDRATLMVTGAPAAVDEALAELERMGGAAWWLRRSPRRAVVRCEGTAADACTGRLLRVDDVEVEDVSTAYAAVDLLGPRSGDVLEAHLAEDSRPVPTVVRRDAACVELLVSRAHGPGLWRGLLEAGERWGIACVGLDALEHLDVSERLSGRRH